MFRTHASTGTGDQISKNEYMKERYHNDEEYRLKQVAQHKISSKRRVSCPECNKEMNYASLYTHVKYKSCKGKPVEKLDDVV